MSHEKRLSVVPPKEPRTVAVTATPPLKSVSPHNRQASRELASRWKARRVHGKISLPDTCQSVETVSDPSPASRPRSKRLGFGTDLELSAAIVD